MGISESEALSRIKEYFGRLCMSKEHADLLSSYLSPVYEILDNLSAPQERNVLYANAFEKWGIPMQIVIAIEELAELQKELTKELRYCKESESIAEEMADVEIVLEQLGLIFNNRDKVEEFKNQKLKRLESLLKSERGCENV